MDTPKPVEWISSSRDDLREFPKDVRWRYLPCRLHRQVCWRDLRPACLSEEIEERHRDSPAGYRLDQGSLETSRTALQRKLCERSQDMTDKIPVKRGSGNVFADLGFDHPEEEKLKAQLVREIRDIIKR